MLQHGIEGKLIAIHAKACNHAHRNFREHAMDISLGHVGNMDFYVRQTRALDAIFQRISRIGEARWIHHHPIKSFVRALINSVDRLPFQICIENLQFKAPSSGIIQKRRIEFIRSGTAVNLWLSLAQKGEVRSLNKDEFSWFAQFPLSFGWFMEVADGTLSTMSPGRSSEVIPKNPRGTHFDCNNITISATGH